MRQRGQAVPASWIGYGRIPPEIWERYDEAMARLAPTKARQVHAMMRVFRIAVTVTAPKIVCTACGEQAEQAGIGVRPEAIETARSETGEPITTVDAAQALPLCEF